MLPDLIVRKGGKSDLAALEWDGEFSHFRYLFKDVYHQSMLGRAEILIAEIPPHKLIGQLLISLNSSRTELADGKTRAYLFGFRVRPSYRNLGVGSTMLRIIEADLANRDFRLLTLNVSQDNQPARLFYERQGYQVVGSDPGQWSYIDQHGNRVNVNEPAWRMTKEITSSILSNS